MNPLHSAAVSLTDSSHVVLSLPPRMPSTLRGQWPLVPVEFPRAGEGARGHTRWFSKRLSNRKRGRPLLRGHALQALGSLPRYVRARGGLSPCRSRGNASFPRPARCRSAVNCASGTGLIGVGRSVCSAAMRGEGRLCARCVPRDPSYMASVEDLPSLAFLKGFHLANCMCSSNPRDLAV